MNPAVAGDWTVGLETLFDRAPDDFSEPIATKININAARTFTSGVVFGGSFEPQIDAHSHDVSYNLEFTLGYVWKLSHFASLGGSAGVGERFQQEFFRRQFSLLRLARQSRHRLQRAMVVERDHVSFSRCVRYGERLQYA